MLHIQVGGTKCTDPNKYTQKKHVLHQIVVQKSNSRAIGKIEATFSTFLQFFFISVAKKH